MLHFKFESIKLDKHSPFEKLGSFYKITPRINPCLWGDVNDSAASFYKFGPLYLSELFPYDDYGTSVIIIPFIK